MNIAIGLIAAMLIGVGLVLQQHAAEQAPNSYFLRLRLIAELLRQRRWLAGIAIMVAGQILSAWTIGHLSLSVAEPLLATELIFALIVAVPPRINAVSPTTGTVPVFQLLALNQSPELLFQATSVMFRFLVRLV